jgi:hypothetical protein
MIDLEPWTNNSQHSPKRNRLVLFAGPHKTASTSIQWFFSRNASDQAPDDKLQAFENWTWPRFRVPDNGNRLFSLNTNWVPQKLSFYEQQINQGLNHSNVVMGTENLCFFESTGSMDLILNWTKRSDPEMIVNYRMPRTDTWMSLWKQYTRVGANKSYENYTFYDYLCLAEDPFPDQINPLRLVSRLVERGWRTHLMDMAGVQSDGLDIAHAIACEILQVPCDLGWVQGADRQAVLRNQRSGNAHLTDYQYRAFEYVLLQHDCSYMDRLRQYSHLFTIHHRQELWRRCGEFRQSNINDLRNFTDAVDVLREIIECPSYSEPSRKHLYEYDSTFGATSIELVLSKGTDSPFMVGPELKYKVNLLSWATLFVVAFLVTVYRTRGRTRHHGIGTSP